MAAVIDLRTGRQLAPLDLVDPPLVPALRVIEGGASPRRARLRRTYLRRRIAVACAAVVTVVLAFQAGGAAVSSLISSEPAPSGETYLVRPGDTMWDVAGRIAPDADRRDTVSDLVALNGDSSLRVGQSLALPAEAG